MCTLSSPVSWPASRRAPSGSAARARPAALHARAGGGGGGGAPVGVEMTSRQAPLASGTRRRTSHCATAARRRLAPWCASACAPRTLRVERRGAAARPGRAAQAHAGSGARAGAARAADGGRGRGRALAHAARRAAVTRASSPGAASGSVGSTDRYTCAQSARALSAFSARAPARPVSACAGLPHRRPAARPLGARARGAAAGRAGPGRAPHPR